jgi:hypothetical protein
MAPWSPRRGLRGRVGVKAPPRTQTHQETDRQIRQREAEVDGVIPGVEGEERRTCGRTYLLQPGADLLSRYRVDVLSWNDAPDP